MALVENMVGNVLLLMSVMVSGCWQRTPGALPAGDPQTPDIIFVSIDTLRADHLSSYGYERETSPFLDSLAAEGVRFQHARSASPWTLPAHTTMFTGQFPATHRVVDDNLALKSDVPVLPELLQQAGYTTGGFVSTLYVSRKFGFERGFDKFNDFSIDTEKENLSGDLVASTVIDDALRWWSGQPAGEPVFLFVHLYDVHYTYDPPPPYDTLFDRAPEKTDPRYRKYFYYKRHPLTQEQFAHQIAQYDESIRYVDDQLKRIAEATAAAGRQVRWVVTSDHGEEFNERGSWGHAHTLYAEQLRIPLIISGAGIPSGQTLQNPVGNHDFAPTIAAWAGVADKLKADGIDLNPSFTEGDAALPERPFLAETTRFKTNRVSLLEGNLRLEWDIQTNESRLFNVHVDPKEFNDLSVTMSTKRNEMKERAIALLGVDWQVTAPGRITLSERAKLFTVNHRVSSANVQTNDCFLVLPYDAKVTFTPTEGRKEGPYASVGGRTPEDNEGLVLLREAMTANQEMDAETRAELIELGYMQEGDDDGAPRVTPTADPNNVGGLQKCPPLTP